MHRLAIFGFVLFSAILARAEELPYMDKLNESVRMIAVDTNMIGGKVELETTIFKPSGDGPFPLLIINHGKEFNVNPKSQSRARFTALAEEFVIRGYVVAVPNARGFSKSDGSYGSDKCKILQGAEANGRDIRAIIENLKKLPFVNKEKIIISGVSYGGFNVLAAITEKIEGVRIGLNFAGGLRFDNECNWELAMEKAASELGDRAKIDSIWFYGSNDKLFNPDLVKRIYSAYNKIGKSELIQYGEFRDDAHGMFVTQGGFNEIWWPKIKPILKESGFPIEISYPELRYESKAQPSNYAQVNEIGKIPAIVKPACIKFYENLLRFNMQRKAIAFSVEGNCGYNIDVEAAPEFSALQQCRIYSKSKNCALYLVDNNIVWPKDKSE